MADLALLRTFMAIYRTGSLTRAAKQLRLTQPAISQQLKALEVQMGWPLFARDGRGVTPTPTADELATKIGAHVDALEAASEQMRPTTEGGSGAIHIAGRIDFLATCILPALAPLTITGLQVVAHPGHRDASIKALRSGNVHVAFAEARLPDDDLEYEQVTDYDRVVIASPRRAAALRAMPAAARAKDLARGPFVAFREEMLGIKAVLGACFDAPPTAARPCVVVPDLRASAEIVAVSDALAVLERPLAKPMLERGLVEEVAPLRPAPRSVLYAVTRRGTGGSPRIRAVLRLLHESAPAWK